MFKYLKSQHLEQLRNALIDNVEILFGALCIAVL